MSGPGNVRTQACRDDELKMSGLQLPDERPDRELLHSSCSVSVCQTATYRWSLVEDLAHYAEAGIGSIALYRPKVEEFEEDLAIDLIRSAGLAVSSLSWVGGLTGSDGSTQEEAIFDAIEALRFAASVKAGTCLVVSGGSGRHIVKHARRLLIDGMRRLCDEAEDVDQRLALHPFSSADSRHRSMLATLEQTVEAVVEVDRKNLGLVFDVHELRGDARLLDLVPEVIPYVHCVRISERPFRNDRSGRFRDFSTTDVMETFISNGYTGSFEFSLPPNSELELSEYSSYLSECRSRFEAICGLSDRSP